MPTSPVQTGGCDMFFFSALESCSTVDASGKLVEWKRFGLPIIFKFYKLFKCKQQTLHVHCQEFDRGWLLTIPTWHTRWHFHFFGWVPSMLWHQARWISRCQIYFLLRQRLGVSIAYLITAVGAKLYLGTVWEHAISQLPYPTSSLRLVKLSLAHVFLFHATYASHANAISKVRDHHDHGGSRNWPWWLCTSGCSSQTAQQFMYKGLVWMCLLHGFADLGLIDPFLIKPDSDTYVYTYI